MRNEYLKEVDRLLKNMQGLKKDPVFGAEIKKLSEIVTPMEEDIAKVDNETLKCPFI